jgi:heptosyltransferase-2
VIADERILVRGVNWVGDAVMTLPALRAIRLAKPDAHIALLVKPWVAPLFASDPNIDEIIEYGAKYRGLLGKIRLASLLRGRKFTSAILLQNAFEAALLAALARIPRRYGFARDYRGWLLTDPIPYNGEDRSMHHVEYYLELLNRIGIAASVGHEPWLYLTEEERIAALDKTRTSRRPLVGINPGAAFGSAKQWPPERFAMVASRAIEDLGGDVIIFGGPREAPIGEAIMKHLPEAGASHVTNLVGRTSLRELSAMIAASDVLVTNDSGPMHIGYAVKTPVVAIFGSTSADLTGPPERSGKVISADVECGPCFERTCPTGSLRCMTDISDDDVFEAVRSLLPTRRAVFFDRDGTLCEDAHFLNDWQNFKEFDDISSINALISHNYLLIGISNQSGIGRGIVGEAFTREVNDFYIRERGFTDFLFCPHHPDEGCSCRKPSPEMLLEARLRHGIDLRRSFVVGDRDADMILGRTVGAKSILVRTGKQQESRYADFVVGTLGEAVRLIVGG